MVEGSRLGSENQRAPPQPLARALELRDAMGTRGSFRTLLDETGAPMKVQQELMRHADIRATMNVYGKAMDAKKREAHGKVVRMVLASRVA